jgi:chaperonin cofactor prefoldin
MSHFEIPSDDIIFFLEDQVEERDRRIKELEHQIKEYQSTISHLKLMLEIKQELII